MAIDAEVVLRLNFLRPQVPSLARHPVEARRNHHLAMRGSWPSRAHVAMCRRSRRDAVRDGCGLQRAASQARPNTHHSAFIFPGSLRLTTSGRSAVHERHPDGMRIVINGVHRTVRARLPTRDHTCCCARLLSRGRWTVAATHCGRRVGVDGGRRPIENKPGRLRRRRMPTRRPEPRPL